MSQEDTLQALHFLGTIDRIAMLRSLSSDPRIERIKITDETILKNKKSRQNDLEASRLAKKDAKKAERRAKAAAAAAARAKQGAPKDDESIASNVSLEFVDNKKDDELSIVGEDPAPDRFKEMLKNAVQGLYDPKAWDKPE